MTFVFLMVCQHDDVSKGKHFPRYWPFVRGIHRLPVNSPHKASDEELWCFLRSTPEPTVVQTMETLMIWDAIAPIMTSLWVQSAGYVIKKLYFFHRVSSNYFFTTCDCRLQKESDVLCFLFDSFYMKFVILYTTYNIFGPWYCICLHRINRSNFQWEMLRYHTSMHLLPFQSNYLVISSISIVFPMKVLINFNTTYYIDGQFCPLA